MLFIYFFFGGGGGWGVRGGELTKRLLYTTCIYDSGNLISPMLQCGLH